MGVHGPVLGLPSADKRRPYMSISWGVWTTQMPTQIAPCAMIPFRPTLFHRTASIAHVLIPCVLLIVQWKY